MTDGLYDGEEVTDPGEIISAYVILNGSLGMQTGKLAAMSFHLGWRIQQRIEASKDLSDCQGNLSTLKNRYTCKAKDWDEQGRRVVVRIAKTEHVFFKAYDACEDAIMLQDEGLTEVEHGSYVGFVVIYKRSEIPKVLQHKKIQLL